jgi:hypothetical protein
VKNDLNTVMTALFDGVRGEPFGGVPFADLPGGETGSALREFGRCLSGNSSPENAAPPEHSDNNDTGPGPFLRTGAKLVQRELQHLFENDRELQTVLHRLATEIRQGGSRWDESIRRKMWKLFFPEGATLDTDREGAIGKLRNLRGVEVTELNDNPLTAPLDEMIFTSNVLLSVPEGRDSVATLDLSDDLKDRILAVMDEPQHYYYDHPIHIGIDLESNEAFYGLRGLNDTVAFEKARGAVPRDRQATVILSLSVTHTGLHHVAREYLAAELAKAPPLEHLQVYLFTEADTEKVVRHLLGPYLSDSGVDTGAVEKVTAVFGVDGEYGRHYSFLKAVAPLWSVFKDSRIRGTFKIDLDQVFPQAELIAETGESALDHFRTPLWGARGKDRQGREVELAMIAGALVNEKDIHRGLFTPDVPMPEDIPPGEAAVFFNKLPMAVSTRAEMMTRYDQPQHHCIYRIHVTGGTNGILLDALRRHRPFTPTFIGRAEDQGYILSVLYGPSPHLRYLHKPGLIMRHDKEAFAGASIAAAEHGRFVGDLARTLLFSGYADVLPWGFDRTKEETDPFTGCFITRRRYTVVFLRLALKAASLCASGRDGEARKLLAIADEKLTPLLDTGAEGFDLAGRLRSEREAWDLFYDALDRAEAAGAGGSPGEAPREVLEATRLI